MTWYAYLFPIVARDDRELEWMAKGWALPEPYPVFLVPRLLRPTLKYELALKDPDSRKLFYLFTGFERTISPILTDDPMHHADLLMIGTIGEPQPVPGTPSPPPYFRPSLSEDSRLSTLRSQEANRLIGRS